MGREGFFGRGQGPTFFFIVTRSQGVYFFECAGPRTTKYDNSEHCHSKTIYFSLTLKKIINTFTRSQGVYVNPNAAKQFNTFTVKQFLPGVRGSIFLFMFTRSQGPYLFRLLQLRFFVVFSYFYYFFSLCYSFLVFLFFFRSQGVFVYLDSAFFS
jgi:hypothetical protein